jgi:hypothetical protein
VAIGSSRVFIDDDEDYGLRDDPQKMIRNGLVSGVTSTTTCFQGVELSTIGAMAGRGEREKSSSTQMN